MKCPKCSTENDSEYIFCVNCGTPIASDRRTQPMIPATVEIPRSGSSAGGPPSVETVFAPGSVRSEPRQDGTYTTGKGEERPRRTGIYIALGVGAIVLLLAAIGVTAWFIGRPSIVAEHLPDYLGLFVDNKEKRSLVEVKKYDFASVAAGRDALLKDESLATADERPEFILYAEASEVPVNDLKVVQLDTIKDDGTMKHLEFQAAPIDGKPAMKRLRFERGLAAGKYAFVLFDGYFEEGKHKFWAFQIVNAEKRDNTDLARDIALDLKSKLADTNTNQATNANVAPSPKPTISAPVGARVAYCNATDVIVRAAPSLNAKKVNELRRGQKVYAIRYSDNYDYWNGMQANWAYIQTESGKRGWVFTPFISY